MRDSLVIVGSGIKIPSHLTLETKSMIEHADKVFCLCNSDIGTAFIKSLNSYTVDLRSLYKEGEVRSVIYENIVDTIYEALDPDLTVCAIFYGHPTFLVNSSIDLAQKARRNGFSVRILPGISAEDCLFADLGIDPARNGCLSMEATEFLLKPRCFDTTVGLILWQIEMTGNFKVYSLDAEKKGLELLLEVLALHYGSEHEVIIYEAATWPTNEGRNIKIPLKKVLNANLSNLSTMYIPPLREAPFDRSMLKKLQEKFDS